MELARSLSAAAPADSEQAASAMGRSLGIEGLDYRLGWLLHPLPGEAIVGTVALGNHGITIHRQTCPNVETIPGTAPSRALEPAVPARIGSASRCSCASR